ncbi:putative mitochondrial hypothetical protein [Leptomonas pyrrhocoris]|uniref:Trypanosoma Tc-38 (p38) protein domain-containing protein n=1 Tax=Leptomonas pyrrhocoris TaxID=157538 RepID=A0A0N0VFB8_LEPPY|nr:putative mitochondrial hypothetical protein [Leptomonas pyrrhocoris]KPA80721.1 putative mitochondrial hypothetical protein [Leptomonas pyrrhocoris]|eukprot:XP_015659160.1 putative mitochondrial hypothetical protein [Leptomonas pyrrhocoris]
MAAIMARDVLQRRMPWWATSFLAAPSAGASGSLLLTSAQRRQLSSMTVRGGDGADSARRFHKACSLCDTSLNSAQAMLTHGRFLRLVDSNRGDVVIHVDTTDFLSWEGTTLTTVPEEAALLERQTRLNALMLPFWVTEPQATELCAYESVQRSLRCASSGSAIIADAFQNRDTFVELTCGTSEVTRYVNWEALCSRSLPPVTLHSCLSFFRCFVPINVRTKRAFDTVVAMRLRVEAMCSDCWCSVWGTADDYERCGFRVLDGALGVYVFNGLGSPAFLIHALCTTTPLEVYAACYPNDSICTTSSS